MVSIYLIQLLKNGEIEEFMVKKFCPIQNGRTLQKKHFCVQNKLHAEEYNLFCEGIPVDGFTMQLVYGKTLEVDLFGERVGAGDEHICWVGEGRVSGVMEAIAAEDNVTNRSLPTDEHPASSPLLRKHGGTPVFDVAPEDDTSFCW
jgi:hypothetical protein